MDDCVVSDVDSNMVYPAVMVIIEEYKVTALDAGRIDGCTIAEHRVSTMRQIDAVVLRIYVLNKS